MFREMRKTIFCDIDGTIAVHRDCLHDMISVNMELLPGVLFKFAEWREKDYYIILTTARPEDCRSVTEAQLMHCGLFWDQLVMGLPVGPRVVINDKKPNGLVTAEALCIERNKGLSNVQI